jgi:hypothetical protein
MYNKIKFLVDAQTLLQDIDAVAKFFHSQTQSRNCIIFKTRSHLYWAVRGYVLANSKEFDVFKIVSDLYDIIRSFLGKDELADLVAKKIWASFDRNIKEEVEGRLTCYVFLGGAIKPTIGECINYIIKHVDFSRNYSYAS